MKLTISLFIALALSVTTINAAPIQEDKVELWDTVWDVLNVLYDGGQIVTGYVTSNPALVSSGFTNLGLDLVSLAIPGMPAGTQKIAAVAVKEGTAVGTKAISKELAKEALEHSIERHGAKFATGEAGKFLVSSADEIAELMLKAKQRIAQGHAQIAIKQADTFVEPHTIHYIIDMGEVIGKAKKGKNSQGYTFRDSKTISFIVEGNGTGSFTPVLDKFLTKDGGRGFTTLKLN